MQRLEVSCAVRPIYGSLGAKGLTSNNCTLCPHCICVFCIYLRTNSDLCHLHHKLIGVCDMIYDMIYILLQLG
jgi:hypothetical protein